MTIFHGPVILSWRLFDGLILYWRYWISVTQTLNWNCVCRSRFNGPVIFLYILKTVWWTNIITGILDPCDVNIYHITCVWVSDLHFMVQWFCLISWRLFDREMLHWRHWFSATLSLPYKATNILFRSVTKILWYSDSALYLQYYLMNKPHSLDIGSDMGHWPVFHDLAILNHLPISAYSGLLKFDMKIFLNVARLEIG